MASAWHPPHGLAGFRTSAHPPARGRYAARLAWLLLLGGLAGVASTQAQAQADAGRALGEVDFPVSCSAQAQAGFNRAVGFLHHMTYPQAQQEFEQVARIDPACAMAHWGIAMTLFQPLWPTRPSPEELQRGWREVRQAQALEPATRRERLFVAAAEAFFLEPGSPDYWLRIRRWETATARLHAAFPEDPEAGVFHALALLALAPGDANPRGQADLAAAILLRVYERNPDHPGAMHYLVHADDTPGRESKQLDIVHKYETVAPSNPHALHMPTHIYTRLGDWDAVIRGNLRAAEAALHYPAGDKGQYVWDEFPHAIEYLVYAYLQKGADAEAGVQLERLRATGHLQPSFKTAFHLSSTQARYALERRAWSEAASIAPREPMALDLDRFGWPEAISVFARGLGDAHLDRLVDARSAAVRLDALEAAARESGEDLFARNIRMLGLELHAWIANAEGREDEAVTLMGEAAELEASTPKHPVTPAPTLPAQELLGDLLMEQRQPGLALQAYQRSLELYPARLNSLLGAARAARAQGDDLLARAGYQRLLAVAGSGTRQSVLEEARSFLHGRGD